MHNLAVARSLNLSAYPSVPKQLSSHTKLPQKIRKQILPDRDLGAQEARLANLHVR